MESEFVPNSGMIQVVFNDGLIYLLLKDIIDFRKETERLEKKLDKITNEIAKINSKLNNKNFIENAPNEVIEEQKDRLISYENTIKKIQDAKNKLED